MIDLFKEYRKYKARQKCAIQNVSSMSAKLEDALTNEQIGRAFLFYSKHREYIWVLVDGYDKTFEPTQSEDKNDPSIWKAGHWKWFIAYCY